MSVLTSKAVVAANYMPALSALIERTHATGILLLGRSAYKPCSFAKSSQPETPPISNIGQTCRRALIETFMDAALQAIKEGMVVVLLNNMIQHVFSL